MWCPIVATSGCSSGVFTKSLSNQPPGSIARSLADLFKLGFCLRQDGVDSALEKSHRGGHLWIFLAEPLLARDIRIYLCGLALRLGIPVKGGRRLEGIEVFPKHDELKPGRYGNAIRGRLGIHRGAAQRFWFDGADEDLEKQNERPSCNGRSRGYDCGSRCAKIRSR
jgi:hypothetical protein